MASDSASHERSQTVNSPDQPVPPGEPHPIEISALRALALAADGEETAAVDALAEALTLGCPQGYVRVFADEGAPMRALLARLSAARQDQRAPARGIHAGYLAALMRACGQADATPQVRRAAAPPGRVSR